LIGRGIDFHVPLFGQAVHTRCLGHHAVFLILIDLEKSNDKQATTRFMTEGQLYAAK